MTKTPVNIHVIYRVELTGDSILSNRTDCNVLNVGDVGKIDIGSGYASSSGLTLTKSLTINEMDILIVNINNGEISINREDLYLTIKEKEVEYESDGIMVKTSQKNVKIGNEISGSLS